jgi:hypothetical protein
MHSLVTLYAYVHVMHSQLPPCEDENRVSISCLNLHYSIKSRSTTVKKDEVTDPLVLVEFKGENSSPTAVSMYQFV